MPTVLRETLHPEEFIYSEANGWRSRDKVVVRAHSTDPISLLPGTILEEGTAGDVGTYAAATGAGTSAHKVILLFPVSIEADGDNVLAGVLVRDAEVVDAQLNWEDGLSDGNKQTLIDALAEQNIIVRIAAVPAEDVTNLPSWP